MTKSRWLAMAILAGLAGVLIISSASGQRLIGTFSAVIFDYEVSDEDGISFATEFERLGGVDTLGHPASYRFQLGDGFIYQLTQGALLQMEAGSRESIPGEHVRVATASRSRRVAS